MEDKWSVEKVKCDLCGHEWIAVHPDEVEQLECPTCSNISEYYEVLELED